jgi:radical SAM superfamily enzyme YgiQ (UPF0313 family)
VPVKVTFIMPCVGRKPGEPYVKTWQMEPLAFAVLSGVTPSDVQRVLYDDRMERVPLDEPTDLVAISVETYTAQRAYQLADAFRARGVPVVLGGFHVTLLPEEAQEHADAIVVGQAEEAWPELLGDFAAGSMKSRYTPGPPELAGIFPDRSIYAGKGYVKISLVETGRGCLHRCEFCSIASFFGPALNLRPVSDVVRELSRLDRSRIVFFIDDNMAADHERAYELFSAISNLNLKWVGQTSLDIARDEELLCRMKKSGCLGVLIGLESIEAQNLRQMRKAVNRNARDYEMALDVLRSHGLIIYATFMFGYDSDRMETFEETYRFAQRRRFFFTAFNHVVPFPGTPLHHRLSKEKRLIHDRWWLQPGYRFGDLAFRPLQMTAEETSRLCLRSRRRMYGIRSILLRALDIRCNCRTPWLASVFLAMNVLSGRDVERRQGLPLGVHE